MHSFNVDVVESKYTPPTVIISAVTIRINEYRFKTKDEPGLVNVMVTASATDGSVVYVRCLVISGDEFDRWGEDDSYIVNLVLEKLGLSPKV